MADFLLAAARQPIANGAINELAQQKEKFDSHAKQLRKANTATLTQALGQLDPHTQSFAYCQFLVAELAGQSAPTLVSLNHLHHFFANINSWQLQPCMADVFVLGRQFVALSSALHRPLLPLVPLREACVRLSAAYPHCLTPLHPLFVSLCVRAKHYRAALSVVNHPIHSVRAKHEVDVIALLQYFYYTGIIFAANQRWRESLDAFSVCLIVPGSAVSAIQVAAYKKLILVSLIHSNEMPSVSNRSVSAPVHRYIETLCAAYVEIGRAFVRELTNTSTNIAQSQTLASVINHHNDVLRADRNVGLVAQLLDHMQDARIQRLTRTFVTLDLHSMTSMTSVSNIESLEQSLVRLIESGSIDARIDSQSGLCQFIDSAHNSESHARQTIKLEQQINEACQVLRSLAGRQAHIEENPIFIAKNLVVLEEEEKGHSGSGGGGMARRAMGGEEWQLNAALQESMRTF